jgi:biotin-(acetyl-CoA carboxylase) ligase
MMASRMALADQPLDLPPGYSLVALREHGDAYTHACGIASQSGAGTLVWVRRYDLVEFAVVLEPEEPLRAARRALFAGMNATADAIAAHCPPEREVTFGWPDTILFDGGVLGGGRLGWPTDCAETEVPAWLVFSVMLRAADMAQIDEVQSAAGVSLLGEGFQMVETDAIVESFARHLMTAFDTWNERGFEKIARDYLERLPKSKAGERRGIDANGDLLTSMPAEKGPPQRARLVEALAKVAWYDEGHRGPRFG